MIFDSLRGPLEMLVALSKAEPEMEWLDTRNLGLATAQAFVVDLRNALVHSKDSAVQLEWIGTLMPEKETVRFEPSSRLEAESDPKSPKLRLLDFLTEGGQFSSKEAFSKEELEGGSLWGGETLKSIFAQRSKPFPGQGLIAGLCTLLVHSRLAQDADFQSTLDFLRPKSKELEQSLEFGLQAICLLIHDSVCCGTGISIETIGTFYPRPPLTFDAAVELRQLLSLKHSSPQANPSASFSWIK